MRNQLILLTQTECEVPSGLLFCSNLLNHSVPLTALWYFLAFHKKVAMFLMLEILYSIVKLKLKDGFYRHCSYCILLYAV